MGFFNLYDHLQKNDKLIHVESSQETYFLNII